MVPGDSPNSCRWDGFYKRMGFPHGIRSISGPDKGDSRYRGDPVGLLGAGNQLSFRHCWFSRGGDCFCLLRAAGAMEGVCLYRDSGGRPICRIPDFFLTPGGANCGDNSNERALESGASCGRLDADRSYDRKRLLSYLSEHPRELLIGVGPGNFHRYVTQGITRNFFGHNSYLHWTGELGIGGILLLLAWCLSICLYAKKRLRSQNRICRLAAQTCLAVVAGRMVAAWGAESLFGTQGMGVYSLFFVGVVYLLVSIASDVGAPDSPLKA